MPTKEALTRYKQILQSGRETPKIDFKIAFNPEGDGLAEAIKDFCALANSQDPAEPEQRQGLLFIGVDNNGKVCGLANDFDSDALELRLTQRFERRIAPPLRFSVSAPIKDESSNLSYAVIAIEPSSHLPHLTIQESGKILPGQWFVRRNSTTVLAGPEEFAELHRRFIEKESQPIRSGLDRLAGEVAVLREDLSRLQGRTGTGQLALPTDLADLPLAEAIRQEYSPKESHLISRIRQLGRELTDQILQIDGQYLEAQENTSATQLNTALDALEAAARPLVETVFEISAFVDDAAVWESVAQTLDEVANITVVNRVRIDGAIAPILWYPIALCAYAAATAAVIQHRYIQLVPLLSGTYDEGRYPLLRVLRILTRAEELYRRLNSNRECAPLANRILQTMIGPAGWFVHRVQRNPEVTGYFAEIVLSLIWMTTNTKISGIQEGHPLPSAFLYQWTSTTALHKQMGKEGDALVKAFPNLLDLLTMIDQNASRYGNEGCQVYFESRLAATLNDA